LFSNRLYQSPALSVFFCRAQIWKDWGDEYFGCHLLKVTVHNRGAHLPPAWRHVAVTPCREVQQRIR